MGLGGDLMWTPVAYEIFKKKGKITCFVKQIKNRKKIIIDEKYIVTIDDFDQSQKLKISMGKKKNILVQISE